MPGNQIAPPGGEATVGAPILPASDAPSGDAICKRPAPYYYIRACALLEIVIFERARTVEYQVFRLGVVIHYEIALFEQLEMILHLGVLQRSLYLCRDYFEAVRIEQFAEIPFVGRGVFYREETVVQTYFGIQRRPALYPVDRRLDRKSTRLNSSHQD